MKITIVSKTESGKEIHTDVELPDNFVINYAKLKEVNK